jgi:hypothetical protein
VRLALAVGTELVFSPVYHPQSNCFVERFHQDYNRHVWEDTYLEDLAAVNKKGQWFFPLYRLREDHDQLHGQSPAVRHQEGTPRQLPAGFTLSGKKLPLREGRIHFMRRVNPQGQVRVLNVDWTVPRFDPLKGVWVTIEFRTTGARLSIFDAAPDALQRDCLATYAFPLNESVLPFAHAADTVAETDTAPTQDLQSQQTAEPTQPTITESLAAEQASSMPGQVSTLPPLTLIPWNNNLLRRSGRIAFTTFQYAARLTRQVVSTMY